jgi:hypothetical protein
MKTSALALTLIAAFTSTALASPMPNPAPAADAPDGLYVVTVNEAGEKSTQFTPFDQVVKRSDAPARRDNTHQLERRREGCGPGSAAREDNVAAHGCLKSYFGQTLFFGKNQWTYV